MASFYWVESYQQNINILFKTTNYFFEVLEESQLLSLAEVLAEQHLLIFSFLFFFIVASFNYY